MEKKLYRNDHDKMLAGVCSGLAEHLSVEVTVIRLVAILMTFVLFGTTVLAYIVLWIILPVNPNRMQKYAQYFNQADPMYTSANAFNNAGFSETNKWNTENAKFQSDPMFDPYTAKPKSNTGRIIGGMALLIVGLYFLGREMNILPYWFQIGKLWPLALIAVGLSFVLKSKKDKEWESFKSQHGQTEEPIVTPPPADPASTNADQPDTNKPTY
ncbi:MAG: PspC domain-containing protein [Chitinophagaceae bacterium]|nr:MAG: PspC domain-containing protein [Chitinophagaceae bacterium]